jgi:hypothetical protein
MRLRGFLSKKDAEKTLRQFKTAIYGRQAKKRVYTQEQMKKIKPLFNRFKKTPTAELSNTISSVLSGNINEKFKSRGERNLMSKEDVNVGEVDDFDFDFNFSDFELSSDEDEDEDEEERNPEPVATSGSGRKKKIKRINDLHLVSANKVGGKDPLYQVSKPKEVQRKAKQHYGKDAIIYKSSNPKKKYQIQDKNTGKWVHFGDAKMEDFHYHKDPERRRRYLARALNIRGKWRENPFSPNTLSILLLW